MNWLALGDSITWGFPWGPAASWTRQVSDRLGKPVDNLGINGDPLSGMDERLRVCLRQNSHYAFAVWMGGTNDVVLGYSLATMQDHAEAIARQFDTAGIPHYVGLPIPFVYGGAADPLGEFRAWLRQRFPNTIDFTAAFPERNLDELLPDGVHPSRAGYLAMAEVACAALCR